jgi:hypothetical protein
MGRAIKSMCSHCQREIYFGPNAVSIEALSALHCPACGHTGAVLTLNIEAPSDVAILDRLPGPNDQRLTLSD